MTDLRDHVVLDRRYVGRPDDGPEGGAPAWLRWQARIDAARAAAIGPPHPADIALARTLAEQERILFGRVRTALW